MRLPWQKDRKTDLVAHLLHLSFDMLAPAILDCLRNSAISILAFTFFSGCAYNVAETSEARTATSAGIPPKEESRTVTNYNIGASVTMTAMLHGVEIDLDKLKNDEYSEPLITSAETIWVLGASARIYGPVRGEVPEQIEVRFRPVTGNRRGDWITLKSPKRAVVSAGEYTEFHYETSIQVQQDTNGQVFSGELADSHPLEVDEYEFEVLGGSENGSPVITVTGHRVPNPVVSRMHAIVIDLAGTYEANTPIRVSWMQRDKPSTTGLRCSPYYQMRGETLEESEICGQVADLNLVNPINGTSRWFISHTDVDTQYYLITVPRRDFILGNQPQVIDPPLLPGVDFGDRTIRVGFNVRTQIDFPLKAAKPTDYKLPDADASLASHILRLGHTNSTSEMLMAP